MELFLSALFAVSVFLPVLLAYFTAYGLLRLVRPSPRPGRFDAEARAWGWVGLAALPAAFAACVYYAPETAPVTFGAFFALVLGVWTLWFVAFGGATTVLVALYLSSSTLDGLALIALPVLTAVQTCAITAWLTSRAKRTIRPLLDWAWLAVAVLHSANAIAGIFLVNRLIED